MPKATNHNKKKAARRMEDRRYLRAVFPVLYWWLRRQNRRRRELMRKLAALSAEFIRARLLEPSALVEHSADYGPLEARADALCASVSQGRLSSGQPSQDLLPWVDYAGLEARVLVGVDMSRDGDRLAMNLVYRPSYIPVPMTIRLMPPEPEED